MTHGGRGGAGLLKILRTSSVSVWTLGLVMAGSLHDVEPRIAPRRVEALAEVLGHAGGDVTRQAVAVLGLGFEDKDDERVVDFEELVWQGEVG
jgi:hypothetical protein